MTGFNTDIEYGGRVFHVQTEDKGLENPIIETLVYTGGQIVTARKTSYAQMLTEAGMAPSGKQVKDALGRSAVLINNQPVEFKDNANVEACFDPARALHQHYYLIKLGKKKYHLFEVS